MNIHWAQAVVFFLLGVVLANRVGALKQISGS